MADTPAQSVSDPAVAERRRRKPFLRTWKFWVPLAVLATLVALRLALPWLIKDYVNRTLSESPDYDGRVEDVDVHLYRAAYTIRGVEIVKTAGDVEVPFYSAERVSFALEWEALLKGRVVGRIFMRKPVINFVDGGDDGGSQTGANQPWLAIIDKLFPFRINSCRIVEGELHFYAFHKEPEVNIYLTRVDGRLENLTNIEDVIDPLLASVEVTATAMDHAEFEYKMKFDPNAYHPTFELATRLLSLDVTRLNNLMQAYGEFDVERGTFDLVVELSARNGLIEGYAKPLFRDLKVLSWKKDVKRDDPIQVFWEALVGTVTELLENPERDQFATRIPLEGEVDSPETDVMEIIGAVLRNAFVQAFLPTLEGTAAPRAEGMLESGAGGGSGSQTEATDPKRRNE